MESVQAMIDTILMVIEVLLLIIVVIQGEAIRFYEKGVYLLHSERDKERREWRDAKKRQALKKSEIPNVGEKLPNL